MSIKKIIIKDFKCFEYLELELNQDLNIIVGDNETGKTTILEAINLALTNQINGRFIGYELSPYLFNNNTVKEYVKKVNSGEILMPPKIEIELYLNQTEGFEAFRGSINSLEEDEYGISLKISLDNNYLKAYKEYIKCNKEIRTIPIEYYSFEWLSFAGNPIKAINIPCKTILINNIEKTSQNGTDKYISKVIKDTLDDNENAMIELSYRQLKELFQEHNNIKKVNENLANKKDISDKNIAISVDISAQNSWESSMTLYLDDIPIKYIGKGEQNSIKTKLAIDTKIDKSNIIMIEEPETNLSYSNMNKLIKDISDKCENKQLIITTHNTFVINKLGIDKMILINDKKSITFNDISEDTRNYFKKLAGYDTLRLVISKKAIIVEGPSDELIVQKAYYKRYNKLPLQNEVDVISIRGLSAKRFLEIADKLNKEVIVITDNDKNVNAVKEKYKEYENKKNIVISYDLNEDLYTLEYQIAFNNGIEVLKEILGKNFNSQQEFADYMVKNKTECALKFFETDKDFNMPGYILDVI